MKKTIFIFLFAIFVMASLSACGETESTGANAVEKVSSAESAMSDANKITEVSNYITTDVWNNGFCDINWYITTGKSSTGNTLDIGFTLERLNDAINEKPKYDEYIQSLDGDKYTKIKEYWGKVSSETDKLYAEIKATKPVANSENNNFDTGLFSQYMSAFQDEAQGLKQ